MDLKRRGWVLERCGDRKNSLGQNLPEFKIVDGYVRILPFRAKREQDQGANEV